MLKQTALAFAAMVLSTSLAAAQAPASALGTFTRGTVSTTAVEWTDIIARDKGFYAAEGLNIKAALISPTTITPSLIGGSIQFGFINASSMILADESGADLVAVGKGADPSPYALVAGKSIKTLLDLKGKTISLSEPGDAYAEATREILRKAGIDPEKDITMRYGGNSNQRMAALVAGAVDAVPLVPPQDSMLVQQGFNIVARYVEDYPHLALSTTAVSRAWAAKNGEVVKAFLRAQAAATKWLYDPANKEEALRMLMAETQADHEAADAAYAIYVVQLHMYAPCVEERGFQTLIGLLSKVNKAVKPDEPASRFVDTRWCPA